MSNNRKFAYAKGDEENTDAFINSTLASAPKNQHTEEMELQTGNFAGGRDGSYYSVDTGRRKEFRNNCANIVVYAFSAFLVLVAIGLFVGAGMQDKNPTFISFCPDCKKVITATFAVGGCILVFAGIGFVAARSRSGFWACLFIVGLVLLTCLFFAVGAGFFIIQGGTHLDGYWKHYVEQNDDSFICNIQSSLTCSGWDFCCWNGTSTTTTTTTGAPAPPPVAFHLFAQAQAELGADNLTSTAVPATTTAGPTPAPAPPSPQCTPIDWSNSDTAAAANAQCLPSCYSNAPPCKGVLKQKMKDLTVPVAVVSFPLGVLCALVAWASWRMLAKEE